MDYEKLYKEALENARQEYNTTENVERKQWLEELFPELQESDDERIRKVQLDYWRSVGGKEWHGVPVQEVIAWLEKQTPKPKWTEEDESKVKEIVYFLDTAKIHYASTMALDDCIDWLKSLKQRMEEQQ